MESCAVGDAVDQSAPSGIYELGQGFGLFRPFGWHVHNIRADLKGSWSSTLEAAMSEYQQSSEMNVDYSSPAQPSPLSIFTTCTHKQVDESMAGTQLHMTDAAVMYVDGLSLESVPFTHSVHHFLLSTVNLKRMVPWTVILTFLW